MAARQVADKLVCADYQGSNARIAPDSSPEEYDANDDDSARNVAKSDKVSLMLLDLFLIRNSTSAKFKMA